MSVKRSTIVTDVFEEQPIYLQSLAVLPGEKNYVRKRVVRSSQAEMDPAAPLSQWNSTILKKVLKRCWISGLQTQVVEMHIHFAPTGIGVDIAGGTPLAPIGRAQWAFAVAHWLCREQSPMQTLIRPSRRRHKKPDAVAASASAWFVDFLDLNAWDFESSKSEFV
ncbi:hypothetical protein Tco_0936985 [Tanacetum coccineum]|uniref:Uncharacterized protein n=1 Tax=Tanacetum coccineum TaxID=301880 RepID=A0ABQ5DDT6_9ASTR